MPKKVKAKQKFFKTAGGLNSDIGQSIAATDKCIFITGNISGNTACNFNNKNVDLKGNGDIFVAGLDHCGNQKFFKTAGGISTDDSVNVAATDKGVFITGFISGNTACMFNQEQITLKVNSDIFVAGLDHCGKQKFFKTAGSNLFETGSKIAATKKRVFVSGFIGGGTACMFNQEIITIKGTRDIFVAGLDQCGKQKFFVTAGSIGDNEAVQSMVATEKGVFVSGFIEGGTACMFDKEIISIKNAVSIYVAGLDHCGKQKFFVTAGGSIGNNIGRNVVATKKRVFATGIIIGATACDFNDNIIKLKGDGDIFVSGLDHCGNQKFFKTAGGILTDEGFGVAATENNVFVTGIIRGTTACDFNAKNVELKGGGDIFVSGLDHCGNQKFFVTAGGISNEVGNSIVANEDGVFITGFVNSSTGTDFKGCPIDIKGTSNVFVAGLDNCGKQKFFLTAGSANSAGLSIDVKDDKIFVSGNVSGETATNFKGEVIGLKGNKDIFVTRIDDLCPKLQTAFRSKMSYF